MTTLTQVLSDVVAERTRQDAKWGEQNHDPFLYLTILGEEYGEACNAALEAKFGKGTITHLREELVQIAAVAVALVECIDRDKWDWSTPKIKDIAIQTIYVDDATIFSVDIGWYFIDVNGAFHGPYPGGRGAYTNGLAYVTAQKNT